MHHHLYLFLRAVYVVHSQIRYEVDGVNTGDSRGAAVLVASNSDNFTTRHLRQAPSLLSTAWTKRTHLKVY